MKGNVAAGAGRRGGCVLRRAALLLLLLLLPLLAGRGARAADSAGLPSFVLLEPGLELAQSVVQSGPDGREALFVILRIDPALHDFVLCMASEEGRSLSLPDWSIRRDLRAGINASMYLPDGVTSTGYMRSGVSVNNGNAGPRLGAFFAAGPKIRGLPGACILERDAPGMPEILEDYAVVVQNFRFMDRAGNALWPGGGRAAGMTVVAEDDAGRILFVLCRDSLTAERFAVALKDFSLSLRTVMYTEGGAQAGLLLRFDKGGEEMGGIVGASPFPVPDGVVHVWKGRSALLNADGDPQGALPNVLGIQRRSRNGGGGRNGGQTVVVRMRPPVISGTMIGSHAK
jgi:hypothetical protein